MPKENLDVSTQLFLPLTKVSKPLEQIPSLRHSITAKGSSSKKRNTSPVHETKGSLSSVGVFVFENGNSENKLSGRPVVARKDRLVQEIENSLAEIEDNYSSTSRLEEEKSVVEMERNALLKDIEETISDIQSHVLNSSELEHEKNALEDECNGLRGQVDHLKKVLESSTANVENSDENDGHQSLIEKYEKKVLSLEEEVHQVTLENEHLRSKSSTDSGEIPSEYMSREVELLHDENANLQKMLHMAEESEDRMAKELTSCHSRLTEIQKLNDDLKKENKILESMKEQLELDREELEEELDSLQTGLKEQGDKNGNFQMLKESKEELARAQKKSSLLENEKNAMNKKVDQLQEEIEQLKAKLKEKDSIPAQTASPKANRTVVQLKSALEKLNKETSTLHESLEKAENEIASLKKEVEKEKGEKEKLKSSAGEKGKKPKGKKENESEKSKDSEEVDVMGAFKRDIYNLKSECQALSETVAKTANEKRRMAKEIETLHEEKSELESKVSTMEGTVEDFKKFKSEKEELEGTYRNLKTLHNDVSKKLEIVNQSYGEKDAMLQQALAEKESIGQLCKDYEVSIEKVTADLAASRQDVSSQSDELKLTKRKFEEERKDLYVTAEDSRREKLKLQDELQVISKRLKASEEEKNSVMQSHSSKGSELHNLRAVVDEMRKELKITQQNLRESEELRLVAEEKMHMTEKVAEDLEKSNAVFNDMAMEKSLELSRTRRTLDKKVEKLSKENSELRKRCGLEAPPSPKSPSPHLAPVAVQMQKVPSLDVNFKHLSKPPTNGQRNSGVQRHAPLSAETATESSLTQTIAEDVQRSSADVRLMRANHEDAIVNNYGNHNHIPDTQYGSDTGQIQPHINQGTLNSAPSEYRIVASEVAVAPLRQQYTSSVVHVESATGTDPGSNYVNVSDTGYEKESFGSEWRGGEWYNEDQRMSERRPAGQRTADMERPPQPSTDISIKQDMSSESAFQVVGYRKAGKVVHEHWV